MIHHLTGDRAQLGTRFLTCGCGHTESGAVADQTAERNMECHFRQMRAEHLKLAAFRAECSAVRNFPLASLVTDAITGDTAALTRVTAIMTGGADPVEDLDATSDEPMFSPVTREYLHRVRLATGTALAPWRTTTCCECGEEVPTGTDGLVPCDDGQFAHVVLHGTVVLGCEGYWLVHPAAVGLDPAGWHDWRDDLAATP